MTSPFAKNALRATREFHGIVVAAGLIDKTVKVRVGNMTWNKKVKKSFSDCKQYLVHDPSSSARLGDVVSITGGWRTSKHKRHVIRHIIAPYGVPIEERPPVPPLQESVAELEAKKAVKAERRAARRKAELEQNLEAKRLKEEKRAVRRPARKDAAEEQTQQNPSLSDVD